MENLISFLPSDIIEKYEINNYNHALDILANSYPEEFQDLIGVLRDVCIDISDILIAGGNESPIPQKFKNILFPKEWYETKIHGDLNIVLEYRNKVKEPETKQIKDFINGYNIDFFKNKIALDIEWNSKDQTFDRDLASMRAYHEHGIIDVGIIITRGSKLKIFPKHYNLNEFGASTTWMGKLIDRLDSRRSGGCPILAIGITPECINGFEYD